MRRVQFDPTDFILSVRRNHCPGARWDRDAGCWWMSPEEAAAFAHALDEESPCRRTILVDWKPVMTGATHWLANYERMQAARPVPEDSVMRSQRLRAMWKAETMEMAAQSFLGC